MIKSRNDGNRTLMARLGRLMLVVGFLGLKWGLSKADENRGWMPSRERGHRSGGAVSTEVQRVSFVGSTNEDCHPHSLCNLQNLHAVPPYTTTRVQNPLSRVGVFSLTPLQVVFSNDDKRWDKKNAGHLPAEARDPATTRGSWHKPS